MAPRPRPQTVAAAIQGIARRFGAARLAYGHGTLNAREEAAWIVLHACRIPFDAFAQQAARELSAAETRRIEKLAGRRIRDRIPAAYLTHEAWLGDFRFYVDRRVIVPRSFIAELLPDGVAPFLQRPVRTALDMCTGSGCLAVLLAHAFPGARVDGIDLSAGALAVARRNVAAYRLASRIRLAKSNLFDAVPARRRYDLIVSNPPYVDAASMRRLPDEYRSEPRVALAGGTDGLVLVHRILEGARRHLNPRGALVCEIGHNRKALERACPRAPFTWLDTSAGDGYVFLLEREQIPA
ncbi:MAG: 50S ribosomal protein L3 N(5)-glutamine methyltransferase [Proteobacteria bacterium]|nr:50S ribosomal protein L3 N(5)-glutamine methyltransferase [Pseudomonadota bacterium]